MPIRNKIILIAILAFIGSFWLIIAKDNYFHWDEWQFFTSFDEKPLNFLLKPYGEHFLPLNLLNHYLLFKLFGLSYFPFQLSVVFLHIVNVLILFRIVLLETKNEKIALFSTLIFGISSVYLDNLVWSQGVSNIGSALFVSAAYLFYLSFVKTRKKVWLALSCVSLLISPLFNAFGLLAAFAFLFISALSKELDRGRINVLASYFLTGIVNSLVIIHFSGNAVYKNLPSLSLESGYKILEFTLFGIVRGTMIKFVYPGLHVLKDGQQIKIVFFILLTLGILTLAAWVLYIWLKDKKTRQERLIKILVYSSLIAVGYLATSIGRISHGLGQAGIPRYTYQPFFFFVILGAIILKDFKEKWRLIAGVLIIIWAINVYSIFQLEYGFWNIMMNRNRQFISEVSYVFGKNKIVYDFEPKGISPGLNLSDYWFIYPKSHSLKFVSSDEFDSKDCEFCADEKTKKVYIKLSSEYQKKFD